MGGLDERSDYVLGGVTMVVRAMGTDGAFAYERLAEIAREPGAGRRDDARRLSAIQALVRVGSVQDSLVVLMESLENEGELTRLSACEALAWIGAEARTALPALERLAVEDESEQVRRAAEGAAEEIRQAMEGVEDEGRGGAGGD